MSDFKNVSTTTLENETYAMNKSLEESNEMTKNNLEALDKLV